MTILNPATPPNVPMGKFPYAIGRYSQVTPFTTSDGLSYLSQLEGLTKWAFEVLVPHINNATTEIVDAYNHAVEEFIQGQVDFTEVVNAAEKLITEASTHVDEGVAQAQQWAANTQILQDAAASTLIREGELTAITVGSISVKAFGAVGDGVTDDTVAIRAAYAKAKLDGRTVAYPSGAYLVTDTITPPPMICTDMSSGAHVVYNGTGIAFDFDKWSNPDPASHSGRRPGRNILAVRKTNTTTSSWMRGNDSTSVGIRLNAINWCDFEFRQVWGFHTGIYVGSNINVLGSCYNTFRLGEIRDNKRNIMLWKENGGWANSNTWIGGSIRHNRLIADSYVGTVGFDSSVGSGNNDLFVNVCFEGGSQETTVNIKGAWTTFSSCSWELIPDKSIKILAGSRGVSFFGGYDFSGLSSSKVDDKGLTTYSHSEYGVRSYGDSNRGFNGDDGAFDARVSGSNNDRLWTGRDVQKRLSSMIDGTGRFSGYSATDFAGVRLDTTTLNGNAGYGAVLFGTRYAEPDAFIGRSQGNAPALVANAAMMRRIKAVDVTAAVTALVTRDADVHVVNLSGTATTITLAAPAAATGYTVEIQIEIVQDAAGGRTANLPGAYRWAGGAAPAVSQGANKRTILVMRYDTTLANWVEVSRSMDV